MPDRVCLKTVSWSSDNGEYVRWCLKLVSRSVFSVVGGESELSLCALCRGFVVSFIVHALQGCHGLFNF